MGKPTPEGARDFLVPTRLQPGQFFALPQSPQIYKQLLRDRRLRALLPDRPCLRDEDLRADRCRSSRQLDVEMAFPEREVRVRRDGDAPSSRRLEALGRDVELATPFPRIDVATRPICATAPTSPTSASALEIQDATERHARLRVRRLRERRRRSGSSSRRRSFSRGELREARGAREGVGREGPRLPRRRRERRGALADREVPLAGRAGGGSRRRPARRVLFGADERATVSRVLGLLRLHLGRELDLIDPDARRFHWVLDFPMFEWDEEPERWDVDAPSVHARRTQSAEVLGRHRPGRSEGDRLRPRRERHRARLAARSGSTSSTCRRTRLRPARTSRPRGAALEVRLPARRARDGRAAARRLRARASTGSRWRCCDEPFIRDTSRVSEEPSGLDPMSGAPTADDPAQLQELGIEVLPQEDSSSA